ncbi:uncharacterized protein LOC107634678 isoform X1 [Arachis ipaensis]|uniref:uncharacterized protein LOC107633729 isoform X1 n=1 Tax=Arachis ipaensis TaxID=130454 RepID=UPI000A2B8160|nr:uncharacterized protein LOC107633729 isoform X1 [Arachis ipaensis]XP_020975153.1 uncharacterized protein LOC107634678 isoform X1 [Arachis ipaensis]
MLLPFSKCNIIHNDEMPNGWPLGLGFLNIKLRVTEAPAAAPVEPFSSTQMPSTSFSSFSSSNLDTEQSTASFFQDKSVSLGRLIGIRGGERGRLYLPNTLRFEDTTEKKTLGDASCSDSSNSKVQEVDVSGGICIPTLLDVLLRISTKTKRTSRN